MLYMSRGMSDVVICKRSRLRVAEAPATACERPANIGEMQISVIITLEGALKRQHAGNNRLGRRRALWRGFAA